MRVFANEEKARKSYKNKKRYWINSRCPFIQGAVLCGTHCSLFHLSKDDGEPHFVILGCKGHDLRIYIDEVIE